MKLSCNVIRDMLPLYAENMVSTDTKSLVEEHLSECEACKSHFSELKHVLAMPEDKPQSLILVQKGIKKRRLLAVITVIMLVTTIMTGVLIHLTTPIWLTAEEAIHCVELTEDGDLKISYTDKVSGRIGYGGIFCYTIPGDTLLKRELPPGMNEASYEHYDIIPHHEKSFWYYGIFADEEPTLLWGDSKYTPDFPDNSIGYGLRYAFFLALAIGAFLLIPGILILIKQGKRFIIKLSIAFLAFSVSTLVVTWGHFLTFEDFGYKLCCSLVLAVLIWLSMLCGWKIHDYHRIDHI